MAKVTSLIIDASIPASILDLLNGNSNFCIQNPFFKVDGIPEVPMSEFMKIKELSNSSTKVQTPKIYFKHHNKFTSDFSFYLDDGEKVYTTKIKIYKPFGSDKQGTATQTQSNEPVSKVMPNVYSILYTPAARSYANFCYFLSQAFEFIELSLILNLPLNKYKTDEEFILAVCKLLDVKDKTSQALVSAIRNQLDVKQAPIQDLPVKGEKLKFRRDILTILRLDLRNYITQEGFEDKTGLAKKFFKVTEERILPALRNPIIIQQWKHDDNNKGDHVIGNLTFCFTESSATRFKYIEPTVRDMTWNDYMTLANTGKCFSCRIIGKIDFDLRSYSSTEPVNRIRFIVKQAGFKDAVSTRSQPDDLDEEFEEAPSEGVSVDTEADDLN